MTRALITQMLRALDASQDDVNECLNEILPKAGSYRYDRVIDSLTAKLLKHDAAISEGRDYLATVPSGERAELIQWLRERGACDGMLQLSDAADMLEADAQPKPLYDQQALELCNTCGWKGIFPGEPCLVCAQQAKQVPQDEPEDLYALALKADNWGQP